MILEVILIILPALLYVFLPTKKRYDEPFMSGVDFRQRRIRYKDPWIIFSFLFIIFEEFLVITVFLFPRSIEVLIFYVFMISSILMVVFR